MLNATISVRRVSQVLGQAKGVIAAIISVWVFANPVTVTGMTGYATTICGVMLYSETKRRGKVNLAGKGERPGPKGLSSVGRCKVSQAGKTERKWMV